MVHRVGPRTQDPSLRSQDPGSGPWTLDTDTRCQDIGFKTQVPGPGPRGNARDPVLSIRDTGLTLQGTEPRARLPRHRAHDIELRARCLEPKSRYPEFKTYDQAIAVNDGRTLNKHAAYVLVNAS